MITQPCDVCAQPVEVHAVSPSGCHCSQECAELVYLGTVHTTCPKCDAVSGDDWSQCGGACPMVGSPHFDRDLRDGLTRPFAPREAAA